MKTWLIYTNYSTLILLLLLLLLEVVVLTLRIVLPPFDTITFYVFSYLYPTAKAVMDFKIF